MNSNSDKFIIELMERAARNAAIIRWFNSRTEEEQTNIRMFYAGELGCPLCEITEMLLEPEDLEFIWKYFGSQISVKNS